MTQAIFNPCPDPKCDGILQETEPGDEPGYLCDKCGRWWPPSCVAAAAAPDRFDRRAAELAASSARQLLKSVAELKSVVVVFSWEPAFQSAAPACVAMGRGGTVSPADLDLPEMTVQVMRAAQVLQGMTVQQLQTLRTMWDAKQQTQEKEENQATQAGQEAGSAQMGQEADEHS